MAVQRERIQVAVGPDLNERIRKVASRLKWSNSQMAATILEESLVNRTHFANWLAARILKAANDVIEGASKMVSKRKAKSDKLKSDEVEYLQVYVDSFTYEQIKAMAAAQGTGVSALASQFLQWGMDEDEILLKAITSRVGLALLGKSDKKKPAPAEPKGSKAAL